MPNPYFAFTFSCLLVDLIPNSYLLHTSVCGVVSKTVPRGPKVIKRGCGDRKFKEFLSKSINESQKHAARIGQVPTAFENLCLIFEAKRKLDTSPRPPPLQQHVFDQLLVGIYKGEVC